MSQFSVYCCEIDTVSQCLDCDIQGGKRKPKRKGVADKKATLYELLVTHHLLLMCAHAMLILYQKLL